MVWLEVTRLFYSARDQPNESKVAVHRIGNGESWAAYGGASPSDVCAAAAVWVTILVGLWILGSKVSNQISGLVTVCRSALAVNRELVL